MKAHLLYRERDFDWAARHPSADDIARDLGLATLLGAMSAGDAYLRDVAETVVLAGTTDLDTIRYRQNILSDCLKNAAIVRSLYVLVFETIEAERRDTFARLARSPSSLLYQSTWLLQMLTHTLERIRKVADEHHAAFESEGFKKLLGMLQRELSDDYLATIRDHLKQLQFPHGVLLSACLGEGNKGIDYVLRKSTFEGGWMRRVFGPKAPSYSFQIPDRDDGGMRALQGLKERGLRLVACALGQSANHVLSFLTMLRTELAFYLGCMNLHDQLSEREYPVCFPRPTPVGEREYCATGLYDIDLALHQGDGVISNDVLAKSKDLIIITGANQGGKSTFLRSVGVAQLMMQCGMFVSAQAFSANVSERIFTHFKREEDPTMKSGKFDEELARMSRIVDHLAPNSLLLFNESFSATNEREGSEIAAQVVSALIDRRIKVLFVTHQYEFARRFSAMDLPSASFLRAERRLDGTRTFKMVEGKPEETSHGEDLYRQIFGAATTQESRLTEGGPHCESGPRSRRFV